MMNHDNKEMDEEKSFEVIQEAAQPRYDQNNLVKRGLTEVSAMFDRNGKGYLDETERALRRMDSCDRGFLGIDKVCLIFESLQAEQERSSQLLEALRIESKKSLNLKKGVIALAVFTILLALANVATSFAIASLVKEVEVTNGELSSTTSGERVATTAKLSAFEMSAMDDETRRRRLQTFICETMVERDPVTQMTEKDCALQGTIKMSVADALHNELQAVDHIVLTCNGAKSLIHGTTKLPVGNPGVLMMGDVEYKVYPTSINTNEMYNAVQNVRVPAVPANPDAGTPAVPTHRCDAYYDLAMYCPTALVYGVQQDCFVATAFLPTAACKTPPTICGPAPSALSPILT